MLPARRAWTGEWITNRRSENPCNLPTALIRNLESQADAGKKCQLSLFRC